METTNNSKNNRSYKIAFASVELTLDFTSFYEAMLYKAANSGKGWFFMKPYINSNDNGFMVSMVVKRPYNKYNPGW